jgi:hypothetical protein
MMARVLQKHWHSTATAAATATAVPQPQRHSFGVGLQLFVQPAVLLHCSAKEGDREDHMRSCKQPHSAVSRNVKMTTMQFLPNLGTAKENIQCSHGAQQETISMHSPLRRPMPTKIASQQQWLGEPFSVCGTNTPTC